MKRDAEVRFICNEGAIQVATSLSLVKFRLIRRFNRINEGTVQVGTSF